MAKNPQPREKSRNAVSATTRKPAAVAPQPRPKPAEPAPDPRERTIRYWPVLAVGVLLLAGGALLSQRFEAKTISDDLFRKLPSDSYLAGAATLDTVEPGTLKQLSGSLNAYAAPAAELVDAVGRSGLKREQVGKALDDKFVFAATKRGGLFVFTLNGGGAYDELAAPLGEQLDNRQTFSEGDTDFTTGTIRGTTRSVAVGRNGSQLYVASNPELVKAAVGETSGFNTTAGFAEVAGRLPAGDGYLFLDNEPVRTQSGLEVPLVGVSWSDAGDSLDLHAESAEPQVTSVTLSDTDGKLLPPISGDAAATGSVSGTNLSRYLGLLQEQRSEADLPKVLELQNGIASVNRSLGKDLDRDFLSKATGRFVYARYPGAASNTNEFGGLAEFPSSEAARSTYTEFTELAKQKLTVPVRRQVVRALPDGTQSREIVAEGRANLAFSDFTVEGKTGQAVTLPGIGAVHLLLDDKRLIVASTPDGVARMLKVTAAPGEDVAGGGELAIRAKVSEASTLLRDPDVLSEWVLATRPARGDFKLNKSTGELSGSVGFGKQR